MCIAAIVCSGKGIYKAGNYKLVNNYQQVPDEVAAICEMVKKDAGDSEFLLAADNYIGPYVRVYDPSICMMFNREGRGNAGAGARRLYLEINAPVFNYTNIGAVGKSIMCNYLVVKIPNEQQKKEIEAQDYQEVGTAGNYSLYRLFWRICRCSQKPFTGPVGVGSLIIYQIAMNWKFDEYVA